MVVQHDFRRHYIIGKALAVAINQMSNVDIRYREDSDLADMKDLLNKVMGDLNLPTFIYDDTLAYLPQGFEDDLPL